METVLGPGRMLTSRADEPVAVLMLGHGAGGGLEAFDLAAVAEGLPPRGVTVARFEQPWKTAGRKVAGPPASLDKAWAGALALVAREFPGLPLFVGGRSAGARVACRCFAPPARGVVCLSFPLHPPGKPASSRVAELAGVAGPVLVLQGEQDPFGSPDEVRAALAAADGSAEVTLVGLPGTHSFGPRTKAARAGADRLRRHFADEVVRFVRAHLG